MLLKILFVVAFACLALADNTLESINEAASSQALQFETSHKNPAATSEDDFQTSHKISPFYMSAFTGESSDFGGLRFLRSAMNFAPTQARPALDPVLSALINEDVRKSIEAKRAIEQEELDAVRAEIDAAVDKVRAAEAEEASTQAAQIILTTAAPVKRVNLEDDINDGFVDQTISLDTAGSENNKKSRIEIKKGPNGQEYEYEYVYYYEDEEEDASKVKNIDTAAAQSEESNQRGKSRYSSIDRSHNSTPTENSLISGKAKGRSSNVNAVDDEIETERLPAHTRFPNRGKNVEVPPTPAIDVQQEKKKISVKRPSLELVDSETFNTDEKQVKGSPRNGDTEAINKPTAAAQEQPARVEAISIDREETATAKIETDSETATAQGIQKSAFDLYAISINDKLNSDLTTIAVDSATTVLPESTDSDDSLTTLTEFEPSSTTSSTTTTTTTTTEAPTTTAKQGKPSLFGNRRPGQGGSGRFNRNKGKSAGEGSTTTTEAAPSSEQSKPVKNRFSRPGAGGRNRPPVRTTAAPAESADEEEEKVEVKEVKPVSSGFARGRPRNRFNLRGSTTEKPAEEAESQPEDVSSTTARSLRARPTLNLRGRTRATTTKAPATTEDEASKNTEVEAEPKQTAAAAAAPSKSSRFNLSRPGGNRLLPRNKYARTTEQPTSEDSAADSSHHNDIKNEEHHENEEEKSEKEEAVPAGNSLNRLKNRNRVNLQQRSDNAKSKAAAAPVAPRKINPLLAKRRLQLGASTTEAATVEEAVGTSQVEESEAKESTNSTADENESAKEDSTEETETTTKQARGLGLLGQRRRLPLRKPGTIL